MIKEIFRYTVMVSVILFWFLFAWYMTNIVAELFCGYKC